MQGAWSLELCLLSGIIKGLIELSLGNRVRLHLWGDPGLMGEAVGHGWEPPSLMMETQPCPLEAPSLLGT